jgi:thiol-disulfide isomerase/thioredoxin
MELDTLIKTANLQKVNQDSIDFTLADTEENRVTLSELKNKVVVINFWAEWCGPCKAEMPSLQRFYERNKDSDFMFLAVNVGDTPETAKKYATANKLTFPVLCDTDTSVASSYGAMSIPLTYIIDKQGKVVAGSIGARPWDKPEIYALIDALLA